MAPKAYAAHAAAGRMKPRKRHRLYKMHSPLIMEHAKQLMDHMNWWKSDEDPTAPAKVYKEEYKAFSLDPESYERQIQGSQKKGLALRSTPQDPCCPKSEGCGATPIIENDVFRTHEGERR